MINNKTDDFAYMQVKDLSKTQKMKKFLFLMDQIFSSDPSLSPFDHPVYDLWLIKLL